MNISEQTLVQPESARDIPGLHLGLAKLHRVDADGTTTSGPILMPKSMSPGVFQIKNSFEDIGQEQISLPWYCHGAIEGFMGRNAALSLAVKLGLHEDPTRWNDDEMLSALLVGNFDTSGNVIYGSRNLAQFRLETSSPKIAESIFKLPELADMAMSRAVPKSLAGGEQPKFTALLKLDGELTHAIVKFSPKGVDPTSVRWKDLLIAEHIALETLIEADIPAANTTWREDRGQVFLISERFDRIGANGRLPMVSLAAFCAEHLGEMKNWSAAALKLHDAGHISASDAQRMALLDAFGSMIGNTDRHFGNLSLIQYPDENERWQLAPAYDMLPMVFAPRGDEIPPMDFNPSLLAPTLENEHVWEEAAHLAGWFWQRLTESHGVSDELKSKAEAILRELPYDAAVSRPVH